MGAAAVGSSHRAGNHANSASVNVPKRHMVWGRGMDSPLGCDNLIVQNRRYADFQCPSLLPLHPTCQAIVPMWGLETPMLCFSDSL